MDTMDLELRIEKAETIAAALTADDMPSKVWEEDDIVRVYVTRELSRGRQQMGHVEVLEDGSCTDSLTRRAAYIRSVYEGC